MDDIVNALAKIQREIQGSGISIKFDQTSAGIKEPHGSSKLRLTRIYRPSSDDVLRKASADVLLVMNAAPQKAAAAKHNHILVPEGGYPIVVPGLALIREAKPAPETSRQARLMGQTGVIAETLLLRGAPNVVCSRTRNCAQVSTTLTQRIMGRLESEGLLGTEGSGPDKSRVLSNAKALAELWGQEEKTPTPTLRGFLYAPSTEALRTTSSTCAPMQLSGAYRPQALRITARTAPCATSPQTQTNPAPNAALHKI